MQRRLRELSSERLRLMSRARAKRAVLSTQLEPSDAFASALAALSRALRWAGRHPLVVGAGAAVLTWLKPRPALAWFARGLSAWRLYVEVRRRFAAAAPRSSFQR